MVLKRPSFVRRCDVGGVPMVSEIWIYGPHLGNGKEICELWMVGGICIPGVGTLKQLRTSAVVQGVLIRVFVVICTSGSGSVSAIVQAAGCGGRHGFQMQGVSDTQDVGGTGSLG